MNAHALEASNSVLGYLKQPAIRDTAVDEMPSRPHLLPCVLNSIRTCISGPPVHVHDQDQEKIASTWSAVIQQLMCVGWQALQRLVAALFRGSSAYEVICHTCGQPSEGSHRATGFYELDIQVRGLPHLETGLVSLLPPPAFSVLLCIRQAESSHCSSQHAVTQPPAHRMPVHMADGAVHATIMEAKLLSSRRLCLSTWKRCSMLTGRRPACSSIQCPNGSHACTVQSNFKQAAMVHHHRPGVQETLLGAEELTGDNQFHCSNCGCKRDATRQMRLRSLPPYLCLSLQRFVFSMKVELSPADVA